MSVPPNLGQHWAVTSFFNVCQVDLRGGRTFVQVWIIRISLISYSCAFPMFLVYIFLLTSKCSFYTKFINTPYIANTSLACHLPPKFVNMALQGIIIIFI